MLVVAGPPGSGKTTYFPVTAFGVDSFNIDDRCAQIQGSYRAISRGVRRAVAKECEQFVQQHIDQRQSFAVETTLRTTAATEQAEFARKRSFATELLFIATDSIGRDLQSLRSRRPRARLAPQCLTRRRQHDRYDAHLQLAASTSFHLGNPSRARAALAPCAQRVETLAS